MTNTTETPTERIARLSREARAQRDRVTGGEANPIGWLSQDGDVWSIAKIDPCEAGTCAHPNHGAGL